MAGLGRGGRGLALLEALKQPVRKPGTQGADKPQDSKVGSPGHEETLI